MTATSHTKRLVTVCDKCLMASCWHGTFMCDDAKHAGTVDKTVGELAKLDRENASYWFTDPATGRLDAQALTEYIDECLGVRHPTDETRVEK